MRTSSGLRIGAVAYIGIAFVGTVVLLIAVHGAALPGSVILLWLLHLGPIGIVLDVLVAATGLTIAAPGIRGPVLGIGFTAIQTVLAWLNAVAVRRPSSS